MYKNAIWTTGTTAITAVVQIAQLMIAARYFTPSDFGLLAIVNIMLWVVMGFQEMGLSSYCIHLGEQNRRSNSTLFWTSSAIGLAAAIFVVGVAYPIEKFYGMPGLADLIYILSINFIILGLSSQYQAHLIRTFQAVLLAKIELAGRIISFFTVLLLMMNYSVGPSSIIYGILIFSIIKLSALAYISDNKWHPTIEYDMVLAPKALRYGVYQAGSILINQIRQQLDQLIIGKVLGADSLGIYSLAKELLSYPMRFIQPLVSRLSLPTFAKAQNDGAKLQKHFIVATTITLVGSVLSHGILVLLSPFIVAVVYGVRFSEVIPLIALLAIFATLRPMGFVVGMVAQAKGLTHTEFVWNLWCWILTLPSIIIVATFSPTAESFAINLSLTQIALSFAIYPIFISHLNCIGHLKYLQLWIPHCIAITGLVFFADYIK